MEIVTAHTQPVDERIESPRDQLIMDHLPQVKRIVHRIAARLPAHIEIDDLIHAALVGLIEAADRYDPQRNTQFMTYAGFRIKGAVLSELRFRDHLGRAARRNCRKLDEVSFRLEQQNGGEVDDDQIAGAMGVDLETVHQIRAQSCVSFVELDRGGWASWNEKPAHAGHAVAGDQPDACTMTGMKETLDAVTGAIEHLANKEQLVLSMYYSDEMTMKEIGQVLGITESRVSQIHSQAVRRIRRQLRKKGHLPAE